MHQRGKFVILFMFALAFGLSGYAWWHRYQENPKSKEFWGARATVVIRQAPAVEFFTLVHTATMNSSTSYKGTLLTIDGRFYVATVHDIHQSPGLVHARHALIDDNSFDWNTSLRACVPEWEFGLRFRDGSEQITVVFDTVCDGIQWLDQQKKLQLVPLSAKAFRKKSDDWGKTARSTTVQ